MPSLIYVIPSVIGTCFELDLCDRNARFGRFFYSFQCFLKKFSASILSPILWIILTKHTFANSLTILYCTPSYRAKLAALMPVKLRNRICSKSTLVRASFPGTTTVRTWILPCFPVEFFRLIECKFPIIYHEHTIELFWSICSDFNKIIKLYNLFLM